MAAKKKHVRASKGVARPKKRKDYSGIKPSRKGTPLRSKKGSKNVASGRKVRKGSARKPAHKPANHGNRKRANPSRKKPARAKTYKQVAKKSALARIYPITGNRKLDAIAWRTPSLVAFASQTPEGMLSKGWNKRDEIESLGITPKELDLFFDWAIEKLHKRGFSNEQILALYRSTSDVFLSRIDGHDYKGWRAILDLIEQEDERYMDYIDLADLLDIDEGDAKDELFSPSAGES